MKELLLSLSPYITETVTAFGMIVIALLTERILAALGVQIEAKHRDALHKALSTGLEAALARGLQKGAAVELAIDYARASVPDALRKLSPSEDLLKAMATSKLGATKV